MDDQAQKRGHVVGPEHPVLKHGPVTVAVQPLRAGFRHLVEEKTVLGVGAVTSPSVCFPEPALSRGATRAFHHAEMCGECQITHPISKT